MVPAVAPAAPEAPAPADPQVRLEWWERLRGRAARSRCLTALLRMRACITWASLAVLGAALAISPVTRTILGAWIGCLWVMVCWFWMARAKTVSWAHVSGVFALSMPWAGAVARLSFHLTAAAGAVVSDAAAQIVVAPVVEELGKLAPLCALALIAPGRTRRLLVQDWLVLGVAAGAGFMAVEETARRLAYISGDAPGLLLQRAMCPQDGPGILACLEMITFGPSPFSGAFTGPMTYAGHAIVTGLVAAGIGLARHLWWRARQCCIAAAIVLRLLAVVLPAWMLWMAMVDHMGRNAADGEPWTQTDGQAPWPIVGITSTITATGHGRGWILLALLALAWVLDIRVLWAGGYTLLAEGDDGGWWGRWRWRAWRRLPHNVRGRLLADLVDLVGTAGIEARWAVLTLVEAAATREPRLLLRAPANLRVARGLAARSMLDRGRGRWTVVALSVVLALSALWATSLVPPLVHELNRALFDSFWNGWLAGVLDFLGSWWEGLSFGQKAGVVLLAGALVVLSGGTLGLAADVGMGLTTVLSAARGAADLVRDPRGTVTRYLTTHTPGEIALDAIMAGLTVVGGGIAGGTGGYAARQARWAAGQARYEAYLWRTDREAWSAYTGIRARNVREFLADEAGAYPFDPRAGIHYPGLRRIRPNTSEGGPGVWGPGRNYGSAQSQGYEEQVTGAPIEHSYYVNGKEFDGYSGFGLIDAKGEGYATLIKADWCPGEPDSLIEIARDQVAAVRGVKNPAPIQWHIAEQYTFDTLIEMQNNGIFPAEIELIFTPLKP